MTAGGDTATDEQVIILTTTPDVRMAEAQLDLYFPDRSRVTGTAYARADFPTSGGVEVLTWQVSKHHSVDRHSEPGPTGRRG